LTLALIYSTIFCVSDDKSRVLVVPLVWLRDHCRDPQSYNATTNQRVSNATDLFERAEIEGEQSVSIANGSDLTVSWKDGLRSVFHVDDIVRDSEVDQPYPVVDYMKPWKRLEKDELPRIHISEFNMKFVAESFVKYGMVMIDGVDANAQATEELCRRVAPIHDTFFGAFWVFSNQAQEKGEEYHEDTAYGNETIGPHTDGTYFNQTPGIQVFHCLHAAEQGGDTVLVDGFECAAQLRSEDPDAFKLLSERKIEHHYVETGTGSDALYSTSREKPVIELDSWGNIVQIR
ncbi:taurine catabolism dioxygenase, TauD/TfdA family, partial [Cooperia oncophora]